MSLLSSMTDAEKEIYAVELEMKLEKRIAAIAYFNECVLIEIAATLALNQFQKKYNSHYDQSQYTLTGRRR